MIISSAKNRPSRGAIPPILFALLIFSIKQVVNFVLLENRFSNESTMGKIVIQILVTIAEADYKHILERNNDDMTVTMTSGIKFNKNRIIREGLTVP